VLEDVEQIATVDLEDDVLESDAARSALSLAFFASSQAKYFTAHRVAWRVPIRHTLPSAEVCPKVCPKGYGRRAVRVFVAEIVRAELSTPTQTCCRPCR
jgi:hypothetical protein